MNYYGPNDWLLTGFIYNLFDYYCILNCFNNGYVMFNASMGCSKLAYIMGNMPFYL